MHPRLANHRLLFVKCFRWRYNSIEGREDKTPRLTDLRGSGAIEQDADIVIRIHREADPERQNEGVAYVMKHRKGPRGIAHLMLVSERATRTARKVSIVKTPTKVKRLAAQVDRLVRLDAMLKDFGDASQRASRLDLANADCDRALWHMLMRWRESLPELDGYFHKCFRQCDVTDTGHEDMVIHSLLSQSERFWKVFDRHRVDADK